MNSENVSSLNPLCLEANVTFADVENVNRAPPKPPAKPIILENPLTAQSKTPHYSQWGGYPSQAFYRLRERGKVNLLHIFGAVVMTVVLIVGVSLAVNINNSSASSSQSEPTPTNDATESCATMANLPPGNTNGGMSVDITTLEPKSFFELNHQDAKCITKQGVHNFDYSESFEYVPFSEEHVFDSATTFQSAQNTYRESRESSKLNFDVSATTNFFIGSVTTRVWGSNSKSSQDIFKSNKERYEETNIFRKIAVTGYFELVKGKMFLRKTVLQDLLLSKNEGDAIRFILKYGSHFMRRNYVGAYYYSVNSVNRISLEKEFIGNKQKENCLGMSLTAEGWGFKGGASSNYCNDVEEDVKEFTQNSKSEYKKYTETMPANFDGKFKEGGAEPQAIFEHLNRKLFQTVGLIEMNEIFDWLHPLQKRLISAELENEIKDMLFNVLQKYEKYMNPERCNDHCRVNVPETISVVKKPDTNTLFNFDPEKPNSDVTGATCECVCPQFKYGPKCQYTFYSERYISPEVKKEIMDWRDKFHLELTAKQRTKNDAKIEHVKPGGGRQKLHLQNIFDGQGRGWESDRTFVWKIVDEGTPFPGKVELYASIEDEGVHSGMNEKYKKTLELKGGKKEGALENWDRYFRRESGEPNNQMFVVKLMMAENADSPAEKWITNNCYLDFGFSSGRWNEPTVLARSSFKRDSSLGNEEDCKILKDITSRDDPKYDNNYGERVSCTNPSLFTKLKNVPQIHLKNAGGEQQLDEWALKHLHRVFLEITCNDFPDMTGFADTAVDTRVNVCN